MGRFEGFSTANDGTGGDYDRRSGAERVNAVSTRIHRFGAVYSGQSGSMSVVVGMENARNQRLTA